MVENLLFALAFALLSHTLSAICEIANRVRNIFAIVESAADGFEFGWRVGYDYDA